MKRYLLVLLIISSLMIVNVNAAVGDYYPGLVPGEENPVIEWRVTNAPNTAFSLYFSAQIKWLAEIGSSLTFEITEISDDVKGTVTLGNATWSGNDTDIAKDLTLGVWGLTPWLPGFVIKIGQENLDSLNETAFAAARRVSGNYMNGTMSSSYQQITVNGITYDCILFNYQQDQSFGEPQKTFLAYDTETGVLVVANTSYSFGVPYSFSIEVTSIPYLTGSNTTFLLIAGTAVILIVVVIYLVKRRI